MEVADANTLTPKSLFHTDLLEKLFLGGNSGYVCSCRKLLHFFCFGNIDKFLHLCYHAWIFY